jgi:putative aldouronate transport system substrate-binding protein
MRGTPRFRNNKKESGEMKKSRILAIALALVMISALLAACTGDTAATPTPAPPRTPVPPGQTTPQPTPYVPPDLTPPYMNATGLPIAKEATTWRMFAVLNAGITPLEELASYQFMAEKTNVHFEFEYVPRPQFIEQLNLAFVANDYADVLLTRGAVTWDLEERYAREGFVIDTRPLIEDWMPIAQTWFHQNALTMAAMTATDGRINGLPFFNSTLMGNPHICYMDGYWLGATGRTDVPHTVDDFYHMLVDIKALMDTGNYGANMYPLGFVQAANALGPFTDFFATAFTGSIMSLGDPQPILWAAPNNRTIEFMPTQPGFRESIAFMRKLFVEELIDPEAFTMDQPTYNARLVERRYAVYQHGNVDNNARRGEYTALRPLQSATNGNTIVKYENSVTLNAIMITDRAEQTEILARYFDHFYTIDTDDFVNNDTLNMWIWQRGFYGQTWEYADAARTTWRFMTWPDGSPVDWGSLARTVTPQWNTWPGVSLCQAMSIGDAFNEEKQRTTARNVYAYCTMDTWFVSVYARMLPNELDSIATQLADVRNFWRIAYMRFITGEWDINADADWNNFLAEMQRAGAPAVTSVFQIAHDRWNAALG